MPSKRCMSCAGTLRIPNAPACCSSTSHTVLSAAFASTRTVSPTSFMSPPRSLTDVLRLRLIVGLGALAAMRGPAGASNDASLTYTACGANCGAFGSTFWSLGTGASSTMIADPLRVVFAGRSGSQAQQLVQFAGTVEGGELIITPDMQLTDKDLRHGALAAGPLQHHGSLGRLVVELDVAYRHALAFEQVARPLAIPAPIGRVHDDLSRAHACLPSLRAVPFTSG